MSKRFIDSELWNRDWFLELDGRSQLFCLYLNSHCDHAGIWNPSFKRFEQSTGFRINSSDYISMCNKEGDIRILVLQNGKWWITGFIEDQYRTKELHDTNTAIKGVINSLRFNQVPYESMGYKIAPASPSKGAKDKDKEEDNIIKKEEECEKEKTKKVFICPEPLKESWSAYIEMRKLIRKPATAHAQELALDKLMELSGNDIRLAINIINQSIQNSYQGFFPLKEIQKVSNATHYKSI